MSDAPRFNVLQLMSDQHIAACLGCEGHPQAITPNLDRLAAQGMRFTGAYTQNPICTPSRVSILSGQYCHNHGYYGLSGPAPGHHGTSPRPSFLQHFRRHGYRTGAIGKLHTPTDPRDWLLDHCDHYAECYEYGPDSEPSPYYAYLEKHGLTDTEDSTRLPELGPGNHALEARPSNIPFIHSVEGWCVQQARQFIDESRQQPWCVQVSLPRPHQCYTPDQQFWDMYDDDLDLPATFSQDPAQRPPHFRKVVEDFRRFTGVREPSDYQSVARRIWRGYLACITQMDHAIGLILEHLQSTGQADNTIVIYHSDHGAYSSSFGVPEKAPGICSEFVCRVPMIWRVPGLTPTSAVCRHLVENIDLAATLPALCALPPMDTVDGKDLTPLLRGGDDPLRQVAVTENPWSKSIRFGPWRLVHYQPAMFDGQDVGELYHIEHDPNEQHNLYHHPEHQPVVERGRRLLLEWLIDTTRMTTVWPVPEAVNETRYPLAADGREKNSAGPAHRIRHQFPNYI